jgi:hypothetical protein
LFLSLVVVFLNANFLSNSFTPWSLIIMLLE